MENTCNWVFVFATGYVAAGICSETVGATIPVTDWEVLVGTSTVGDDTTNSPTFTPADAIQIAGGFSTVTLSDNQFIKGTTTLELNNRSTPDSGLGNQIRFALFREVGGGTPTAGDGEGYTGFSVALQNNLRDHHDPARAQPFSSGGATAPVDVLVPAGADPEADTVTGTNVSLDFTLKIVRDGDNLDISGSITDGADYLQEFSVEDYEPLFADFSWNRMAFLIANNSNAESANLVEAQVLTGVVPEPASGLLLVSGLAGFAIVLRKRSRDRRLGAEAVRI